MSSTPLDGGHAAPGPAPEPVTSPRFRWTVQVQAAPCGTAAQVRPPGADTAPADGRRTIAQLP